MEKEWEMPIIKREYKVLDCSGGTTSHYLEDTLNNLSEEGWIIVCPVGDKLILVKEDISNIPCLEGVNAPHIER